MALILFEVEYNRMVNGYCLANTQQSVSFEKSFNLGLLETVVAKKSEDDVFATRKRTLHQNAPRGANAYEIGSHSPDAQIPAMIQNETSDTHIYIHPIRFFTLTNESLREIVDSHILPKSYE